LTEEETVLSVACESPVEPSDRQNDYAQSPVLFVLPKGVRPFEVHGHNALYIPVPVEPGLLTTNSDFSRKAHVSDLYGQGAGYIKFSPPSDDLEGAAIRARPDSPVIVWKCRSY